MSEEQWSSDASPDAVRRGLSRRQMIKASAVAGAAAWTAPVIIDSLSSPAAAFSNCHKKYLKLTTGYTSSGASFNGCCSLEPSCNNLNNGRDSGEANLCSASTCGGPASKTGPAASVASVSTNYYKVTLPNSGGTVCGFDQGKFTTAWSVRGNTAVNGTCTQLTAQTSDTGVPSSGAGYFVTNGNVAYISKTAAADFIYLQYCCNV